MTFNSWTFLVFFLLVLALYRLPIPWSGRKLILLVASYLFYAAWSPPLVLLLWITTLVDWFVARAIYRATSGAARKALMVVSLAGNVGLLAYFKYGQFLMANCVRLLDAVGVEFHPAAPSVILPVGISFYTFVTLSYTVDVYRGRIPPAASFLDYCLLVTFFPHLVAGPILRAEAFLPQCREARQATSRQLVWGALLLMIGLFEKMTLADGILAPVADAVYASPRSAGTLEAWLGTLAFSGQIFCDFEGYSLCAIGAALCLGFAFPDNFHFPYGAVGFSDFWRRWHISLSTWLRDYLYVSIGGNRGGSLRTAGNLMITMLIGGLWHGASWHFVIWGALHGGFLVAERTGRSLFGGVACLARPVSRWGLALSTYFLTTLAWVFFRAPDCANAVMVLKTMAGGVPDRLQLGAYAIVSSLLVTSALVAAHWLLRNTSYEEIADRLPWPVLSALAAILLIGIALAPGDERAFIYFQF